MPFYKNRLIFKRMENVSQSKIESEIAELTKQIEAKRRTLELEKGIIEEKEFVRQVVAEKISEKTSQSMAQNASSAKKSSVQGASYLDSADEATSEIVNNLLGAVFLKGIDEAIKEAEKEDPYIMDAFHDALIDKLYDELRSRKIVN